MFDYRSYKEFWAGLNLVDRRDGKIVLLEAHDIEHYIDSDGRVLGGGHGGLERNWSPFRNWIVIINVALATVVGGVLYLKRRRRNA